MYTIRIFISFLLISSCLAWISYGSSLISASSNVQVTNKQVDREYVLKSTMIGYTGMEGLISGVLNPVLTAKRGEIVKIIIINGELMPHDIALEKQEITSEIIFIEGDTTSIVFEAKENDVYYCTIPGHRQSGMEGRFEVVESIDGDDQITGIVPRRNGRPLNFNFERGTLADWTAEGDAFTHESVLYMESAIYDEDMYVGQSGEYFVSSGGTKNYTATGMLTSVSFEVTHPWASFMVSGGALQGTRVELVREDTEEIIFQITGNNHSTFRPVVVSLEDHQDRQIYIRIIDEDSGVVPEIRYIRDNIWAHINFDDFRFYEKRPSFVNELRREDIVILPLRDIIRNNDGLSGEDATRAMELPEGFSVTLGASEPDVIRPIAIAMDDRGRVWVAEGHTYPQRAEEGEGLDQILIFEDTTGDGTLDSRTVFMDNLNLVSGLELGFGGVWIGAAPYLMFVPVDDRTGKPTGEPEILLDGWGYQDTHETLNSFQWGPDGWLYGAHGVFTHSNVGKPGETDEKRKRINAGIWRYHPTHHDFEVVAHGTSNPWGVAFNDVGHMFSTVCVIPHLFHIIPGAIYHRQSGQHFNPFVYDDIKTIADHVHWMGDRGPHAGNFRSAKAGGGHAHAGAMFYLGNSHWGLNRDVVWMNNIHGFRVNTDHIKRSGSGYNASHGEDFLLTHDSWSQWLNYRIDPAGSVFAIDWYDKNQCHSRNPDVHEKTLGRIFKISHELDEWVQIDLNDKSSLELVEYQLHENDWYVQHGRRILQERGPDEQVHQALWLILDEHPEVPRKLRALWALYVTEGLSDEDLKNLLIHQNEYLRGWAIQLLMEKVNPSDEILEQFAQMARQDESALVRLHLASALQQVKLNQRWDILEGLLSRSEDNEDHNLPLMVWYAAEPLVETDMERAIDLALQSELLNFVPYTAKRITDIGSDQALQALESSLRKTQNHDYRYIIMVEIDNLRNKDQ